MIPRAEILGPEDLLLKDRVVLYDNTAEWKNTVGRLFAEFQIYPSPRLSWDFEILSAQEGYPEFDMGGPSPIVGTGFCIDRQHWRGHVKPRTRMGTCHTGLAQIAHYGDLDIPCREFTFYLPNTRFLHLCWKSQAEIVSRTREEIEGVDSESSARCTGRSLRASLDDTWHVRLRTSQEAMDWLDPLEENLGVRLTTQGWLYPAQGEERDDKPSFTLMEATDRILMLGRLLTFANAGYVGPLYVEGIPQGDWTTSLFPVGVLVMSRVTPLEQVGTSWITTTSDLASYINLLPVLDRMVSSPQWGETFDTIMVWYLQAVGPQDAQARGRHWAVVANALGAALECLSNTILVAELGNRKAGSKRQAIKDLLGYIGLTAKDQSLVDDFYNVRNDATHAIQKSKLSREERNYILRLATQWVDEVLLWRLGYTGRYRPRASGGVATNPRYDINRRRGDW